MIFNNQFYNSLEFVPSKTGMHLWFQLYDCPAVIENERASGLACIIPVNGLILNDLRLDSPILMSLDFFVCNAILKKSLQCWYRRHYFLHRTITTACQKITDALNR